MTQYCHELTPPPSVVDVTPTATKQTIFKSIFMVLPSNLHLLRLDLLDVYHPRIAEFFKAHGEVFLDPLCLPQRGVDMNCDYQHTPNPSFTTRTVRSFLSTLSVSVSP